MKNTLFLAVALAGTAAFANETLTQVASHAKGMEQEFMSMSKVLKNKNFSPAEIEPGLQSTAADLEKIKALIAEFESSQASFTAAQQAEWKRAKDLVALIEIFHTNKSTTLKESEPRKARSMLRAKAEGLAKRAAMLHDQSLRLAQAFGRS